MNLFIQLRFLQVNILIQLDYLGLHEMIFQSILIVFCAPDARECVDLLSESLDLTL